MLTKIQAMVFYNLALCIWDSDPVRDCLETIKIRNLDRNKICIINTTTINIKNQSSSKVQNRIQKMKDQERLEPQISTRIYYL